MTHIDRTWKFTRILSEDARADHDAHWCEVEIKLTHRELPGGYVVPRLSICGAAGHVRTEDEAREDARQMWISHLEDMGETEGEAEALRLIKNYSNRSLDSINLSEVIDVAAQVILDVDGEFHGVDFHAYHGDDEVLLTHSCGQIRGEILGFFPEVRPLLPFHLNDMCQGKDEGSGWLYRPLPLEVLEALSEGSAMLEALGQSEPPKGHDSVFSDDSEDGEAA